jgi:hypothetical protein
MYLNACTYMCTMYMQVLNWCKLENQFDWENGPDCHAMLWENSWHMI